MSVDSIVTMVAIFVMLTLGPGFIGRSLAKIVIAYRAELEKHRGG